MTLVRRQLLRLAAGVAVLPVMSRVASALEYPSQPVRLIVPYAPGGTTDTIARQIGPWLSERLAQAFVIESRPGAGTNVGTDAVAHAAPDGNTLLLFDPSAAINATLYEKLNFNFIRDIAPIVCIFRTPLVIVVNPSLAAKTLPEFIAYAKANPGKINMASAGIGSSSQLAGELFKEMASIDMTHIPYRGGGPAIVNLLGGQVEIFFSPMAIAVAHIHAGKLRALATTGTTRSDVLPEFVPGFETSYWIGLGAPKNTPVEIIGKLNTEINAALADPGLKLRFADLGGSVVGGSADDFAKLVSDETDKWGRVVRAAHIKAE
jgi:tripartite-type tricarboxylate transporter receptor subunit TctC